ncbi:hypothetical protein FRC17_001926 [Serendipita sp. 399]|nr:hypothetical protein FRC17_001926 [Serendipita sp. 399]
MAVTEVMRYLAIEEETPESTKYGRQIAQTVAGINQVCDHVILCNHHMKEKRRGKEVPGAMREIGQMIVQVG